MPLLSLRSFLLCASFFLLSIVSRAQSWDYVMKAVASDRKYLSSYGFAVSVSGNYAVVGAMGTQEDTNGNNSIPNAGAAYILYNNGSIWMEVKKICAPVRAEFDYFGMAVAISGDYVIVGAENEAEDGQEMNTLSSSGAAYIFKKQGGPGDWIFVKKITAPTRRSRANFGHSVAIKGDYAIVGAYEDNNIGGDEFNFSGAAYIYKKDLGATDNWGILKEVTASDASGSDQFGSSVSITNDYAIIGAPQSKASSSIFASGAAYVIKKDHGGSDNWGEVKKLTAPVPDSYDYFGGAVAIDGDNTIIGAVNESEDSNEANTISHAGAAYVFSKNWLGTDNWGLVKKLAASVRHANKGFGISVSISENTAVAGSNLDDYDASGGNFVDKSGTAYVFKKDEGGANNWGQFQKVVAPIRYSSSNFGRAVDIDGNNLILGANLEGTDENGSNEMLRSGSVYLFAPSNTSLPVTLRSFTVMKSEKQSFIHWTTTAESDSDYFEVQRSSNARDWQALAKITATNRNDIRNNYTYTDSSPANGENIYRIKMVDHDKTFAYSSVRSVVFGSKISSLVYPNPVSDKLYIEQTELSGIQEIRILSLVGNVLVATKQPASYISVKNLTSGMYVIQITRKDGSKENTRILVKR